MDQNEAVTKVVKVDQREVATRVATAIMAEVQVDLDPLQAVHLTTVKQKN